MSPQWNGNGITWRVELIITFPNHNLYTQSPLQRNPNRPFPSVVRCRQSAVRWDHGMNGNPLQPTRHNWIKRYKELTRSDWSFIFPTRDPTQPELKNNWNYEDAIQRRTFLNLSFSRGRDVMCVVGWNNWVISSTFKHYNTHCSFRNQRNPTLRERLWGQKAGRSFVNVSFGKPPIQ